jgi:hypothetical protein
MRVGLKIESLSKQHSQCNTEQSNKNNSLEAFASLTPTHDRFSLLSHIMANHHLLSRRWTRLVLLNGTLPQRQGTAARSLDLGQRRNAGTVWRILLIFFRESDSGWNVVDCRLDEVATHVTVGCYC